MRRLGVALLAVAVAGAASPAWAKKKAPAADDDDDSASDSDNDSDDSGDAKPAKKKADKPDDNDNAPKKKKKKEKEKEKVEKADASASDDGDKSDKSDDDQKSKSDPDEDFKKQDLSGHDLGTKKKTNEFEKDRFYVDKQDTEATENKTLIQGSITSSSFYYTESGSEYPGGTAGAGSAYGTSASNFSRMFTDLRLQTDFRHIKGGNWDGRVDARIRLVDQPTPNSVADNNNTPVPGTLTTTEPKIQSGLTGQNEYEIRELWIVRNSDRSDIFIGRQFIADLAAVKIDGVRVDYAQSSKFTLLGFGGLFPMRGSRSITTDYIPDNYVDASGNRQAAGRFSVAGGFGAAYRTLDAYGSFGGVVEAPLSSEEPRIFATSTGYWRYGTKLDFYHFAVIDLVGEQESQGGFLTNLSAGVNYKPNPRLRLTASYNRVDNDTLSVQAGAYLNSGDASTNLVDNEVYLQRLSTNEVRGSASAALGQLERFELTGALSFKYRPAITLFSTGGGITTIPVPLQAEEGGEFYGSITDRHSIKDMRLGLDFTQTFGLGSGANYQHTQLFGIRASAGHDIKNGQGEIEGEIAYTHNSDQSIGQTCQIGLNGAYGLDGCFGDALNTLISVGGSVYYRFNRDWLGVASFYVSSETIERASTTPGGAAIADPSVIGLTGFLRASYRF